MTLKRREGCEVGRRVHVGQQPVAIAESIDLHGRHDVDAHGREQVEHLQLAFGETMRYRVAYRPPIHRTQRMISAFGFRHHNVDSGSGAVDQMRQQRGRDERHIARDQHDQFASCVRQRGVEAAERSAGGDAIRDRPRARVGRAADDQNLAGDRRKDVDLPLEDRASVDDERAFVAAVEARRQTSREDRRRNLSQLSALGSQRSALSPQPLRCSPDRSS